MSADRYTLNVEIVTDAEDAEVISAIYELVENFNQRFRDIGQTTYVRGMVIGPDGSRLTEFRSPFEGELEGA